MSLLVKASASRRIAPQFARFCIFATRSYSETRNYSELRRQPPPIRSEPIVETFSATSRPRAYYAKYTRGFPLLKKRSPTRRYSELRRQSPPTRPEPIVETFSATSRPQSYYAKHPRELPRIKKRWPTVVGTLIFGVAAWAAFMTYVTNQEMISSSVVRQIMRSVREDDKLREVLGEAIRPQPEWWLNGDPLIQGKISQLQGNVDVSFRIKGSKGAGTLYFTSIRKEKGVPFTILRFKVICDDGTIVLVDAKPT